MSEILDALYRGESEEARRRAEDRELDVFEAAALGRGDRLAELCDRDGSLVGAVADDGFTPLHLAAFFGGPEAVAVLLARSADADALATNGTGLRPLHSAAARSDVESCRQLVAAGADVNAAQQGGYTPLMAAALHGQDELAELLLAAGADRAPSADDGRTAADMAAEGGFTDLAARLRTAD